VLLFLLELIVRFMLRFHDAALKVPKVVSQVRPGCTQLQRAHLHPRPSNNSWALCAAERGDSQLAWFQGSQLAWFQGSQQTFKLEADGVTPSLLGMLCIPTVESICNSRRRTVPLFQHLQAVHCLSMLRQRLKQRSDMVVCRKD
jgi:hypothetical protein